MESVNQPMGDIQSRILRLETESTLRRLVYEYCHGLDKRDAERFLAVWHPDARWLSGPLFGDFYGKEEIHRALVEHMWPAFLHLNHWTTNFVITEMGSDRASGVSDMYFAGPKADGEAVLVSATYNDQFERREGKWRIAERAIAIHYFSALPGVVMKRPTTL